MDQHISMFQTLRAAFCLPFHPKYTLEFKKSETLSTIFLLMAFVLIVPVSLATFSFPGYFQTLHSVMLFTYFIFSLALVTSAFLYVKGIPFSKHDFLSITFGVTISVLLYFVVLQGLNSILSFLFPLSQTVLVMKTTFYLLTIGFGTHIPLCSYLYYYLGFIKQNKTLEILALWLAMTIAVLVGYFIFF